jgi:hypothetical protein
MQHPARSQTKITKFGSGARMPDVTSTVCTVLIHTVKKASNVAQQDKKTKFKKSESLSTRAICLSYYCRGSRSEIEGSKQGERESWVGDQVMEEKVERLASGTSTPPPPAPPSPATAPSEPARGREREGDTQLLATSRGPSKANDRLSE